MSYDESDHFGQLNFAKLKSLRANANWNIEDERRKFLRELYTLIRQWKGRLPNLRDVFRKEEIDWLLTESLKRMESIRLVNFVILTGYRNEPDVGEDGKPLFHRTTPLHRIQLT
ncbi:unnamed protein product [Trichogramma brassicae]|uniref:Uncharacterized protein n=1 Tax=Trichogramma brassicae TaxID=86971 RepID=A0A6H5I9U1_9HYME|nr:unnamed protein product [Trichogramma brassicae]